MKITYLTRKPIRLRNCRTIYLAATFAVAIFGFAPGLRAQLAPPPFAPNDVLISAENSQVFVFNEDTGVSRTVGGAPLVYTPVLSPTTGGMAFDHQSPANLLLGLPDAAPASGDIGTVGKFDANGNATPPFGTGYGGMPFSMAADRSGNIFVGEEGNDFSAGDGSVRDLLKFNATGTTVPIRYQAATEAMGAKWMDLACDDFSTFYTSESRGIKRFDTRTTAAFPTGRQLPDFVSDTSTATVPDTGTPFTGPLECLKIVPDGFPVGTGVEVGQVVVATRDPAQGLLRFSKDGTAIVRNYRRQTKPAGAFVGLSFDPSQPTIWTVDVAQSPPQAVEFDVESGAEVSSFPLTGVLSPEAITLKGERLCGNPPLVPLCGRMCGGGSFPISNGTNASHGFTLSTVNSPPNRMTIYWKDSTGNTNRFCLTQLTSGLMYDDPTITPSPPRAGFDTYMGTGNGQLNGVAGATANWTFTDKGEPGTNDTVSMQIRDKNGILVLTTVGTVNQNSPCGNHRAHACP